MAEQPTDVHLNPVKILSKLEDVMSADSVIVADGGDFVGTAAYILRFCRTVILSACTALVRTHTLQPRVGSGAVRIGPLCFLTGGSKSRTKSGCGLFC